MFIITFVTTLYYVNYNYTYNNNIIIIYYNLIPKH